MGEGYKIHKLGDWELQSGEILPDAFIAYSTYGNPRSPAIVYPTWFSGSISDNSWLIGEDKTLDPRKYFIIIPALFGNGQSSSPSNHPSGSSFPSCGFYDNVRAQHNLVTRHLRISHLRAVTGWSMGAGQTYQWATMYPDFMDLIVPFCGAAKTSMHNQVFLESLKATLLAVKKTPSPGNCNSAGTGQNPRRTWTEEENNVGLRSFGRVYAGWGFSQAFYRERLFVKYFRCKDLESFLVSFWEEWALSKDPENLLVMLHTWQTGDCSQQAPYNGDFEMAMQGIKAKALVLPCRTDLYFPPEDSEIEVTNMMEGVGRLDVFPSTWGHWAGGPGDSGEDVEWLDAKVAEFFAEHGQ
ncbi:MAG: hypothetical protein M1834_000151 [Cirrosporium novae-zelandiae]|nr:MAG: hypothetical protein M1834_000151 [Cirrosporium novae-zelandiae]